MTPLKYPKIPLELVETIVEHFHSDKSVLAACSLVCSSWIPLSRRHLYREVHLCFLSNNDLDRSQAFLDILASPLCTIKPYIRHCLLRDLIAEEHYLVLRQISGLSAVRSLEIEDSALTEDAVASLLSNFNTIEQLSLEEVTLPHTDLLDVLGGLVSLQSLTLLTSRWKRSEKDYNPIIGLQSLIIHCYAMSDILKWLSDSPQGHDSMHTLELLEMDQDDLPVIGNYLRLLPRLYHLSLNISNLSALVDDGLCTVTDDFCAAIDLRAAHNLRTLTLRDRYQFSAMALFAVLPPLLRRTPLPALERLVLEFSVGSRSQVAQLAWPALAAALSAQSQEYPALRALEIVIYGRRWDDADTAAAEAVVRAALPELDSRGILAVSAS